MAHARFDRRPPASVRARWRAMAGVAVVGVAASGCMTSKVDETRQVASPIQADESIVLLKNEGGLLPFGDARRILVTGPLADAPADLLGPWHARDLHRGRRRYGERRPTRGNCSRGKSILPEPGGR